MIHYFIQLLQPNVGGGSGHLWKRQNSHRGHCSDQVRRGGCILLLTDDTLLARFYVFWCGWFQVQVVEIKITIITISFGIAGPATTAAPVRRQL